MLNKVLLNGRLVADVELNNYGKGKNAGVFTRFTLAVNGGKTEDGESVAEFITCKAFNKTAELLEEYVKKGDMVTIVGKLVNNNWNRTLLVNQIKKHINSSSTTLIEVQPQ